MRMSLWRMVMRKERRLFDASIISRDKIRLTIRAGNGGPGLARFNGVGGNGGNVYVMARRDMRFTDILTRLNDSHTVRAGNGAASMQTRLVGAAGSDTIIHVPVGIEAVDDESQHLLCRCARANERFLIARGGAGGSVLNNFTGEPGERLVLALHLKLSPNVGVVGFPNAGKSTLVQALVPKKRIKIASYPFTTTNPQLCHLVYGNHRESEDDPFTLSIADLPGLVEGAHANRGRGHSFLKHLEHSDILLFVVDVSGFQLQASLESPMRSAIETVALLNRELERYHPILVSKPAVLCINKVDLPNMNEKLSEIRNAMASDDWTRSVDANLRPQRRIAFSAVLEISAREGRLEGLPRALREIHARLHPLNAEADGGDLSTTGPQLV